MTDAHLQNRNEYTYRSTDPSHTSAYLQDAVLDAVRAHAAPHAKVLDAGCGNGWFSQRLNQAGFSVAAIDSSTSGIQQGVRGGNEIDYRVGSVYDDLLASFGGKFDVVVALEVVEHLYDPRFFVRRVRDVLNDRGVFVLSTPYHGYLKNLALAVSGKLDAHFSALWDGGHIKFWSRRTLSALLEEAGFEFVEFRGAGRLPFLWKSMIVVARKR